jgi:putative cell wall-binding protein
VRIAGADRYETAALLSSGSSAGGVVYVASGENFPDALAGAPAAAIEDAPLLLVSRDAVPGATAAALDEVGPSSIVILGGEATVSPVVAAELASWAPVTRIAGVDRYDTASRVSRDAFPGGAAVAVLATGTNFPDALSGAAYAAGIGEPYPVLLTDGRALGAQTRAELERLNPEYVIVLGGPSSVSEAVVAEAEAVVGQAYRIAGSDRYETSAMVADLYDPADAQLVFLATGTNFPDALAAAPLAGVTASSVLLVPPTGPLPASTRTALSAMTDLQGVVVVGGPTSVSDGVVAEVSRLTGGALVG